MVDDTESREHDNSSHSSRNNTRSNLVPSDGQVTVCKSKNVTAPQTVDSLKSVLDSFDCPIKYNINRIKDPIRKCNNISSIHLGDYAEK